MQQRVSLTAMAVIYVMLADLLIGCARSGDNLPTAFNTPDEAIAAFISALQKGDVSALKTMLGPGTADLVTSGDPVADRTERETFLSRYHTRHELVAGDPDDLVLMVGEDRWPLPIPLTRTEGRWSFDGAAGAQELLLRRIGANELRTIQVMQGLVAAQNDYASVGRDGAQAGRYAARLRSNPGRHDGLYWEVAAGEPPSPAGPLLAAAAAEGYPNEVGKRVPYHGYLFKTLTSQGPSAEGGARDYWRDGALTGGFAVLAYPATYRVSGVMSFMVNQDGVIWQRDLGSDTAGAAARIDRFDPNDNWVPVAPED